MKKQTSVQEHFQSGDFPDLSDAGSTSVRGPLSIAVEILLIITLFILIIGLFSMPIAFHFTDSTNSTNLTLLREKLFALQQNTSVNQSVVTITNSTSSCKSELLAESWVQHTIANDSCSTEIYSGSICTPYLQVWRSCVLDKNEPTVEIASSDSPQSDKENLINELNPFLINFPECQSEAIPFLCQYSFPLMDCVTGQAYQSSKEECLRISTSVCAVLWNLAIGAGYKDSLPVCGNLQEANDFPSNQTTSSNISYNATELECKEGFTIINATCHPKCDGFIQNPTAANIFLLTSELLAAIVVILISILIGVFFIKNRVGVFAYPSFLIIFMAVNMLLQAILVIISATDREALFCSSPGVIESLDNPTTFTIVSGVIYHYLLMNLILWWFVHVLLFTTRICLPAQSLNIIKQRLHRYISAFTILFCFLLPSGALAFAISESHIYRLQRLPPGLPTTSTEMWFYSIIFLYCILLATGLCMLVVSVWTLLKRALRKKTCNERAAKANWSLVSYFTLSASYFIVYVIYSSVWTVNYNNLTNNLTEYFLCEALGSSSTSSCDRQEFEKYSYPFLEGFASLCRVLVPLGILIVAVNCRGLDTKHHPCCDPSPTKVEEKTRNISVVNPAYF